MKALIAIRTELMVTPFPAEGDQMKMRMELSLSVPIDRLSPPY